MSEGLEGTLKQETVGEQEHFDVVLYDQAVLEATHREAHQEATYCEAVPEATHREADQEATYCEAVHEATHREADQEATYCEAVHEATDREADQEATYFEAVPEATHREADQEATHCEAVREAIHCEVVDCETIQIQETVHFAAIHFERDRGEHSGVDRSDGEQKNWSDCPESGISSFDSKVEVAVKVSLHKFDVREASHQDAMLAKRPTAYFGVDHMDLPVESSAAILVVGLVAWFPTLAFVGIICGKQKKSVGEPPPRKFRRWDSWEVAIRNPWVESTSVA
jgi:hypothetical protein